MAMPNFVKIGDSFYNLDFVSCVGITDQDDKWNPSEIYFYLTGATDDGSPRKIMLKGDEARKLVDAVVKS